MKSLENQLTTSQGAERLELLIEITERYNSISPPTALEFAQQSLDLLETHPDPAALARITHQMCWAYQNLGDYRTALTWCNQSAAVAEREDNEKALARALNTTGVVFWRLADYDRSIDFLLRALRLEEAHGTLLSQSRALTNIGIVQKTMGNYDSALDFYARSLEIKEREGDTRGIANVLNNMELLAMGIRDGRMKPLEVAERLDKLQMVGERTIYSLERLLDLSAIELGKGIADLAPHDLARIIEDCLPPHRQAARSKNIELFLDEPLRLPLVLVDANRIGQVLDNLVSNAIKYTHPGGAVRVECETQPSHVITHVRDTGQGLRPEDLELVFRRFRTLSASPTGGESSTGLGLAIAKGIVEVHGGEIWVESQFGVGSCFSFSLPAT